MTTIAAYIAPGTGTAAIAGDRLVFHGDSPICEAPKVFRMGDMLVGVSGPSKVRNVVAGLSLSNPTPEGLTHYLMSVGLTGADILCAHDGKLFVIDEDCAVDECATHYAAVGSGMQYALGWLGEAWSMGLDAKTVAGKGVCAASRFDQYTGDEIDVEVME